jgi:thiamine biosynthesis protein ThiS
MPEYNRGLGSPRCLVMTITLNGEPFDVSAPLTVADLLARLDIDARRVAVEHNLIVLKRATYATTELGEGDQVEIVNFVGGGAGAGI